MEELRGKHDNPCHFSSGGIVYRQSQNGTIEVLLLHRFRSKKWPYDSWHLPKGTMREDETKEGAAKREIQEETGYHVAIEKEFGSLISQYDLFGTPIKKTTYYFLCRPLKQISEQVADHDEAKWVEIKRAIELVSQFPIWEKEEIILAKFQRLRKQRNG